MNKETLILLIALVVMVALMIFATYPESPIWQSLPWPSGTYHEPTIIERTTP